MLQRCLKKSAAEWISEERGSAQVIEFSYVFPVVLVTLTGLMSLVLLLFFYVYSFHLTETAVEGAARAVGGERVYWQLSGHSLDESTREELGNTLETRLKDMQVVPGLSFSSSLEEKGGGGKIVATATGAYRGRKLFTVRSERALRKPTEFAENVDLAEDIADDTGLSEFLKNKFGRYIDKNKVYL